MRTRFAFTRRSLAASAMALIPCLLAACAPTVANPTRANRPTPTPLIVVAVVGPSPTPIPLTQPPASATPVPDTAQGISETLQRYFPSVDPEGSKRQALTTLREVANPNGIYRGAWWFNNDNAADIYEVLAVVFYTEGNLNIRVQQAIAARYLWYCAGAGTACSGESLVNFLAYFQPWREPEAAGSRFASDKAKDFLVFANDLVWQRKGILTALIPGADQYIRNPEGLEAQVPINWPATPFHFANVDPSWDTYLRQSLGRGPNGYNRLWVLTMAEASQVCPSAFICQNMTQARK